MKWEKSLVTGGAGFIGSHIADKLLDAGKDVIVYDNLDVGKPENIPSLATFIKGDINDTKSLKKAMQNIDVIFHNAAFVSIRGSFEKLKDDAQNNILGSLNVLEVAASAGVKKVIFASSMAVYGESCILPVKEDHPLNPISPYGYSKMIGEYYCKVFNEQYGLKSTCLRYFNTYGIRQTPSDYVGVTTKFIKNVFANRPMEIFGNGDQTRDFVWVEDVAMANILAAEFDISNECINIASGKELSINKLATMIQSQIGGVINYTEEVPGEITRIIADITKAKKLLGYNPKGDFQEQIIKIIEWMENGS